MEKKMPIITIHREYGAGGRSVARGLSEKLGLPWYDQDFIAETARDSGFSVDDIKKEGETLSTADKIWDYINNSNASYNSSHDKIFEAQKAEILKLAQNPCILVGRLSNYILREAGIPTIDIFLYADMEHKMKRIAEMNVNGKTDLRKFIEKREALRKNYYKHYTKRPMGECSDFTISIDTGAFGIENSVEILYTAIKSKVE